MAVESGQWSLEYAWCHDRTILVVGGLGTLGRAVVRAVAPHCRQVVTLSRRPQATPHEGVPHMSCDITDAGSLEDCAKTLSGSYPLLGAVINCAGCNTLRRIDEYTPRQIETLVNVNLIGAMLLARATVPLLKRAGGGKLINVASQAGIDSQVQNTVYSAAKAGVVNLGKGLARELAKDRISVITVSPGDIESAMIDSAIKDLSETNNISADSIRQQLRESIPSGRFATPEEIAEVIAHLLCVRSDFLTGTSVVVAGARTCQ